MVNIQDRRDDWDDAHILPIFLCGVAYIHIYTFKCVIVYTLKCTLILNLKKIALLVATIQYLYNRFQNQ